jgi:hypothetical protein
LCPTENFLLEDGDRIKSTKPSIFIKKSGPFIMSRTTTFALILIYIIIIILYIIYVKIL